MIENSDINTTESYEQRRVEALKHYHILDTNPEKPFTQVAKLAAQSFDLPIALISFIDTEHVFIKAAVGATNPGPTPRNQSLCSLVLLSDEVTVFNDIPQIDPCLLADPLLVGELGFKFYAGAPIVTQTGFRIGTVCVIGHEPRDFSAKEQETLKSLAAVAMDEIELRIGSLNDIENKQQFVNEALVKMIQELLTVNQETANMGTWSLELETMELVVSQSMKKMFGYAADYPMTFTDGINQILPAHKDRVIAASSATMENGDAYYMDVPVLGFCDQKVRWLRTIGKIDYDLQGKAVYFSGIAFEISAPLIEHRIQLT